MSATLDRAPLPDLAPDAPAGENLEFDPLFSELERLAQGKPEQQYGATIVPAEEPDWKEVEAGARALLERTYDLRVMALLGVARLHRDGLPGYAESLGTVREVLERHWGPVHPQLDPEDDNDPTLRANALLALGEPVRVLRLLRNMPLARSARAGIVSWRDIAVSGGALEPEEGAARMTEAVIEAAFRESDPARTAALRGAIGEAIAHSVAIPAAFDASAGYGTGPDFGELTKLLRDMAGMMDRLTPAPGAEAGDAPAEEASPVAEAPGGTERPAAAPRAAGYTIATLPPPSNRADAIRLLDLVTRYYEEHEPSSPLPMLIARARRIAGMTFMDILRDMAPDGVSQAEIVTGRPAEE